MQRKQDSGVVRKSEERGSSPIRIIASRYHLKDVLGEGGLATVWQAWDERTSKDVAVKIPHPDFFDSLVVRSLFSNEVQALSRIKSPSVVSLLDYGFQQNQPFIAMELINGILLSEHQKQLPSPRSLSKMLGLFTKICDAVQAAHSAMYVHRDVKINNLFVIQENGSDHVKLFDFGFAKPFGDDLHDPISPLGTLEYIAPEQTMERQPADWRSDIYSLGVLFYYMLTDKYPFDFKDRSELVELHRSAPPVHLATRKFITDSMTDGVCDLTMRALAKDPKDRFQAVCEMRENLEACISSIPRAA